MLRRAPLLSWLLVAPALIIITVMLYYPMIATLIESFYASSFISQEPTFIGLAAYQVLVGDGTFWKIVLNSLIWTAAVVVLQNLLGFLAALLLNQRLPGQGLLRSFILLPWILPGVVAAILWRFMYDPQLGLINSGLVALGLTGVPWLAQSSTALGAAIIAAVWKGFPFSTVIYLAALQNVDQEQVESATIDGANRWQRLFDIVIPAVKEIIAINVVLTAILTFNYFDMIWVLTRGGPQDATHIFPTKIYELGFGQFRFGDAATYGVVSILLLGILIPLYFLIQMRGKRVQS